MTGVEPDGPADRGGLEIGMVITDAANRKVASLADFREALANRPAGRDLLVRILKGTKAEFRVIVDRSGPADPGPLDLPPPVDPPRLEPVPGTDPRTPRRAASGPSPRRRSSGPTDEASRGRPRAYEREPGPRPWTGPSLERLCEPQGPYAP